MTRPDDAPPTATIRIDKWLWHARFFKTRGLAAKVVSGGHMRVNSSRISKPAHGLRIGDVLTFPQAKQIRVVRVVDLSERRGPATEAQVLYEDLTPEVVVDDSAPQPRRGRPDKQARRAARERKRSPLE